MLAIARVRRIREEGEEVDGEVESEEMDEEAGTMPGNVAGLLGDLAGIQNQRASVTSGSVDLRVQGLPDDLIRDVGTVEVRRVDMVHADRDGLA